MSILSLDSLCLADNDSSSRTECLDLEELHKIQKDTADVYLQTCKKVGVVPVSYFLRNLGNSTMCLNHHGLGPRGGKALALALVTDMNITSLELADNFLLAEGTKHLVEMLKANFTIRHLDLSDNHLQSEGAEFIAELLSDNISIKSLKLSGNEFKESEAKGFAEALTKNYRLNELDLSHNRFCGKAGKHLGQMLANNEGLEVLNLSWNRLRLRGVVSFCAGLGANVTLKRLDLSWNGFGNEGALALGEALKLNDTLEHLNLANNHITNEGVARLCKGLEVNTTLRVLMLAYNPVTVEGALALLTMVKNTPKTALEEINISNVLVNEQFVQQLEQTYQEHPYLVVEYRGVGGFIAKKTPEHLDPMKIIQDYLDEQKLRVLDFFRNIDKDGTMSVSVADFSKTLQQSNIPLKRRQIEELIQRLDRERTGMIDYRSLSLNRKQMILDHRRQLRRVESQQKMERQKREYILKTFHRAMEANASGASSSPSPGEPWDSRSTTLCSWPHSAMSSSGYSITHVPRAMPGDSSHDRLTDSTSNSYYSQSCLPDHPPTYTLSEGHYDQEILSDSDTDLTTADHLTRSRPALTFNQKQNGQDQEKDQKPRC
ncbi:hypothetical protein DPEC_G00082260 [Dallia pectoralis]|uniref:Uncharacterized protein n=1 Tax=Dallia pectoralis TaxID=75939 RepID=A0ACC2GYQ6_DALPE|nr:hypothetical protein DPEC_G00082260 [Dallia pectoralis]